MKYLSTCLTVCTLCILMPNESLAQDAMQKDESASEQRNRDFVERRTTEGPVNFAEQYYQASLDIKGMRGVLSKTEDEWTPRGPFGNEILAGTGRVNSIQFHPSDTNTWFICVAQGGIWKTTNAGQSWITISGDLPILRTSYLCVHPTNPDIMYVALGDFAYLGHNLQANENKRNSHYGLGVYKTTDGGGHWFPTGLSFKQEDFEGSLIAKILINRSNPNHLIAVGQTGCYVTLDSGEKWTQTNAKLFWDLEQDPIKDSVLYATTGYVHSYRYGEVSVVRSDDFGLTWIPSTIQVPSTGVVQRIEIAIAPSDPSYIYAIACDTSGGFYGFYRSVNAGLSFTRVLDNTYQYNMLGWSFNNDPGGQGRYDLAICVDKRDKLKVLIGGVNMWQTSNGGSSFQPVTYWALNYQGISLHADIHEIVQHPVNHSFFACHDGGISRTLDVIPNTPDELEQYIASTNWTHYTRGLNITSFYRLSVNTSDPSQFLAGAQDNSTVYGDGSGFYNISGGDGMESLFQDEVFYRYTSSQNGRIYAFNTFGGSFDYEGVITPPWNEVGEWTTPFVGADNLIYILYGNLYVASGTFQFNRISNFGNMPGYTFPKPGTALAVEKKGAKRVYIGKRGYSSLGITNEIMTSSDGGSSWSDISDSLPDFAYPAYLEMSQRDPNKVWLCFSGFDSANKVFFSANAGNDWQNITYDLPNIPVNCLTLQDDGSGILYAGTDLGVFYLMKDSTKWVYYSNNLPRVIVSELEIDTANKTLVAATFGRGVWETGLIPYVDTLINVRDFSSPQFQVSLYPNPAITHLRITFDQEFEGISHLRVVNIAGAVLIEEPIETDKRRSVDYSIENLAPGEYFVIISTAYGRAVRRFIKM